MFCFSSSTHHHLSKCLVLFAAVRTATNVPVICCMLLPSHASFSRSCSSSRCPGKPFAQRPERCAPYHKVPAHGPRTCLQHQRTRVPRVICDARQPPRHTWIRPPLLDTLLAGAEHRGPRPVLRDPLMLHQLRRPAASAFDDSIGPGLSRHGADEQLGVLKFLKLVPSREPTCAWW